MQWSGEASVRATKLSLRRRSLRMMTKRTPLWTIAFERLGRFTVFPFAHGKRAWRLALAERFPVSDTFHEVT